MSADGPSRHLLRRSDLVALGGKAEVQTGVRNDAIDPLRHFETVNYRIAKGSLDHVVGERENLRRNLDP